MTLQSPGRAIEDALAPIVGTEISSWRAAADMAMIGFGPVLDVETRLGARKRSSFGLHLICDWRAVRSGSVAVGQSDYQWPPRDDPMPREDFDPSDGR